MKGLQALVICAMLVLLQCAAMVAGQRGNGLIIDISSLKAQVQTTYSWGVSNTPDKTSITVPVGSNMGWAQVQYTVSYTRTRNEQLTYVLSGVLTIQETGSQMRVLELPSVSVNTGSGQVVQLQPQNIACPSLTITSLGSLSCNFTASYAGSQPLPGTVTAQVSTAAVNDAATAAAVPFDFSTAESVPVGETATITNYFEQGANVMQPYGVSGTQPPPGLTLEDNRVFSYIAFFGDVPASNCGQQWQVVSSASVSPVVGALAAAVNTQAATTKVMATVAITLSGCAGSSSTPAFAGVTDSGSSTVAPAPAAPSPSPRTPSGPAAPGITFAEAGSTLCGGGACAPGSRCFDGWNCCPTDTQVCGGVCCDGGRVCINNQCTAAGSIPCGTTACAPGSLCTNNVCCPSGQEVCGGQCCDAGSTCINGQCAAAGSKACGSSVCSAGQVCTEASICCAAGEVSCAGLCCGGGNICLQNAYCVPAGSTVCGGTVCQSPQTCAGGQLCCDPGATFCGGSCCPSGSTCSQNRCLQPGQTVCGSNICSQGQTCQGGSVCCDAGATFCNNGCCASGNVCVNNLCAPAGSVACGSTVCNQNQFCGNPLTNLCCQNFNQIGCFTSCCPSPQQICNQFTQQCVDRVNTACTGGTHWCAGANQCCPAGTVCAVGQCVTSGALGRRLLEGQQSGSAQHREGWGLQEAS